jgi:hypothetical protein
MSECATCKHSEPVLSDIETEGPLLKCRRYPPTVLVLDGEVIQAFPDASDPCGEWSGHRGVRDC